MFQLNDFEQLTIQTFLIICYIKYKGILEAGQFNHPTKTLEMKKLIESYCRELKSEVDAQLIFIKNEQKIDEFVAKESYKYLIKANFRLKEFLSKYRFSNCGEEIMFFKTLKPQIFWPLIYHNQIYRIEKNIPDGGYKEIKNYYKIQLSKIKDYFNENREFYWYHRTNNNLLDSFYFKRGNQDISLIGESFEFEFDENYATPHSFKISRILANEKLVDFLEEKIRLLQKNIECQLQNNSSILPMEWTLSKAALVELIYALEGVRAFNDGNIQLKTIANNFGIFFNIDLSDTYRIFSQIKDRKLTDSKFIDKLKEAFNKKIHDADE